MICWHLSRPPARSIKLPLAGSRNRTEYWRNLFVCVVIFYHWADMLLGIDETCLRWYLFWVKEEDTLWYPVAIVSFANIMSCIVEFRAVIFSNMLSILKKSLVAYCNSCYLCFGKYNVMYCQIPCCYLFKYVVKYWRNLLLLFFPWQTTLQAKSLQSLHIVGETHSGCWRNISSSLSKVSLETSGCARRWETIWKPGFCKRLPSHWSRTGLLLDHPIGCWFDCSSSSQKRPNTQKNGCSKGENSIPNQEWEIIGQASVLHSWQWITQKSSFSSCFCFLDEKLENGVHSWWS